jgi:hypothetical protein
MHRLIIFVRLIKIIQANFDSTTLFNIKKKINQHGTQFKQWRQMPCNWRNRP